MINRVKKRHRYRSMFYDGKFCCCKDNSCNYRIKSCVIFPQEICLTSIYRDETINAIKRLHCFLRRGDSFIVLDFSKTKKIYPDGMIFVYAEIDNAINHDPNIIFSCKKIKNGRISQVLQQVGIYTLCGQRARVTPIREDVIHWRVCRGVNVIGQDFDTVVDEKKELAQLPEGVELYGACVEATKNSKRHAYIEPREAYPVAHEKVAWWVFSQVRDGHLTVLVCDLGLTIPKTLPRMRKKLFDFLKGLGKTKQSELIAGALNAPTSRSQEDYRGNGLPKIAQIAKETKTAYMIIHSGHGTVCIDRQKESTSDFPVAVPGTIISWRLPLGG